MKNIYLNPEDICPSGQERGILWLVETFCI